MTVGAVGAIGLRGDKLGAGRADVGACKAGLVVIARSNQFQRCTAILIRERKVTEKTVGFGQHGRPAANGETTNDAPSGELSCSPSPGRRRLVSLQPLQIRQRPVAATVKKGYFWGYPNQCEIGSPLNCRSFLLDFESIPGNN